MTPAAALAAGLAFFVVGLGGAATRRSLLVVLMSTELCVLGAAIVFAAYGAARGDPRGAAYAVVVLVLGAVLALVGAATAIAVYRRRATVNLDELRELRG